MKELSLFSGAGGGLLATKYLLGWECIGYVEIDEYCQAVLAQRIEDGYLDPAPIFGDIKKFIEEGYAEAYRGMVDVITAGFPCQPFSSAAGGLQGAETEKNLWPQTIQTIRIIRPRFIFLENVPNLLVHPYVRQIYGELASSGFCLQWDCLPASAVGANHRRDRWWLVGYPNSKGKSNVSINDEASRMQESNADSCSCGRCAQFRNEQKVRGQIPGRIMWWKTEPSIPRVDDGVANRVDRLKAIGNGQVPIVAATAWKILSGEIE